MSTRRYNTRDRRNVPMGDAHTVDCCARYNSATPKRPYKISFQKRSLSGLTYDYMDINLTAVEATVLCDMLADAIARNSDMPADF